MKAHPRHSHSDTHIIADCRLQDHDAKPKVCSISKQHCCCSSEDAALHANGSTLRSSVSLATSLFDTLSRLSVQRAMSSKHTPAASQRHFLSCTAPSADAYADTFMAPVYCHFTIYATEHAVVER
jgi:hypothetical protein